MASFKKPFLSPQQQVQHLLRRGMQIADVQKAEECLERIGYYRLSAYWQPFRESYPASQVDKRRRFNSPWDDFRPNTSFSTVHDFYVFDKKLRLVVLDALERVEVAVRTQIALVLGARDIWAHRQANQLDYKFAVKLKPGETLTQHQEWLARIDSQFKRSKEDFAKHFRKKYPQDNPPIWVAVELWDFGTLSNFYSGMKTADRDLIASMYGVRDGPQFETWLRCLNDVRNLCAHHSRLWNRPLVNQPSLPVRGALPDFDHMLGNVRQEKRLYAAVMILRHLLLVINPATDWRNRLKACVAGLPANPTVTLDSAGFPKNWTALPLWV